MPEEWSPDPAARDLAQLRTAAAVRRAWTQRCGIYDLPDARRDMKPWLPEEYGDRDVTAGRVYADGHGKPECWMHGAMNRVDQHERIYRCQEMRCGVGARIARGG